MIAIKPITINSSNLSSTNVAEADYSEWNSGTTYTLGGFVIVASVHNIYKSLIAGNLNHDPTLEVQGDPAKPPVYWLLVSKTNRYKMFDELSYSQTENANSIEVTVHIVGRFTALSILNIECKTVAVGVTAVGYGTVYSKTFDMLNYTAEPSFYSYFYDEPSYTNALAILDLPNYYDSTITVTLNNPSSVAKCGGFVIGTKDELGLANYGMTVDLKDFSSLLRQFDGTYTLVKRQSAKVMELEFYVQKAVSSIVLDKLANYLGTPVLFIGDEGHYSTYVYGILTKGREAIPYPTHSLFSISVDGFI